MNSVTVNTGKSYQVKIGAGILGDIGEIISSVHAPCKIAVISDSNVWPIYGADIVKNLSQWGYGCVHYVFPAGEENKNAHTYLNILNFLADNQITRSDLMIALGGGVTGDLTGFAAATYLRGIDYIQIPTSLLAMVDSSVGGKTGIDLTSGKNLVGAFHQPILVVCDTDVLSTLPRTIFIDGCSEIIKYGILFDEALFAHLDRCAADFDRGYVIKRCIELKAKTVEEDEYDTGVRQKLNLGHTLGHGIELESNFTLSHGQAVSIGMAIVARIANHIGLCDPETVKKINSVLDKFGLPTKTDFKASQIYSATLSDKKRLGNRINLIIPQKIGLCCIYATNITDLETFIEASI